MPETIDRIRVALADWLSATHREVRCADGKASPVANATVTGHPRAVLTIRGVNAQIIAQGAQAETIAIPAGGGVFVTARAWNRPTFQHRYRFLTIEWQSDVVRYYLRAHTRPYHTDGPHWLHFLPTTPQPATRALVQALEGLARRGDPTAITPALVALIHQAQWELAQRHDEPNDSRWNHLRDWLDENLGLTIDRGAAARACGMHPNSVSRMVTRQTGESFVAYLTRRRIERASALLARYDLPIAAVASRCGFTSGEYFANVFRRHSGMTPSTWARTHREA